MTPWTCLDVLYLHDAKKTDVVYRNPRSQKKKTNTLEEKSFQTTLTFYSIPIFDIKYLQDNLLCVPIMLDASEAHNQKEINLLVLVNETK